MFTMYGEKSRPSGLGTMFLAIPTKSNSSKITTKKEQNQMNKLLLSYIAGLVIGAGSVLAIVEIVFTR